MSEKQPANIQFKDSIAKKIILYTIAVGIVSTIIFAAIRIYLEYVDEIRLLESRLDEIETVYLQSITNSVWVANENVLTIQLNGLAAMQDMQYLEILLDDGNKYSSGIMQSENTISRSFPLIYQYRGQEITLGNLKAVASLDRIYDRIINNATSTLLEGGLQVFLISTLLIILIYFLVGRHLVSMANYASQLDLNKLDIPLKLNRKTKLESKKNDELSLLESSINEMRSNLAADMQARKQAEEERKELEVQLYHSQKMESLGMLAGGIAHDFNNILQIIVVNSEKLLSRMDDKNERNIKSVNDITNAATRAAVLTRQILGFVRGGKYEPIHLDLNDIISDTMEVSDKIFKKNVEVEYALFENLYPVYADQSQMEQVIANLVVNARDAMPDGGKLKIISENITFAEDTRVGKFKISAGDYAKISISDTGSGINQDVLDRIFDPFFSTKKQGEGTGLGLSTAYGIVKNHDGNINAISTPGEGSTFEVYLPASKGKVIRLRKIDNELVGGTETLLFVDDEADIGRAFKEELTKVGYTILLAHNGEEAVEMYKHKRDEISLVLLDMIMPVKSGKDAYHELKSLDSGVKILIMSAFSYDLAETGLVNGAAGFIRKPFRLHELCGTIRNVLNEEVKGNN